METLTKLRLRKRNGKIQVIVLVNHPMTSGSRGQGKPTIQPRYIEQLIYELNDKIVAEANMGPGVAENPLSSIVLSAAKSGDRIKVRWIDSHGVTDSVETLIK